MTFAFVPANPSGSAARGERATRWIVLVLSVCLLPLFAAPAVAKEKKVTRIVAGAVLDDADNGLTGATVVLTDLRTGKRSAAYTQEGGRYQFSNLSPNHDYEVQASYRGAESEVHTVSSLDSRTRIVVNLRIALPKS